MSARFISGNDASRSASPSQKSLIPFVAGLSYKTAPVDLREQVAVPPPRLSCASCQLKIHGDLHEVVLLSTCNRVEIYGVARDTGRIDTLLNSLARTKADVTSHAYVHEGEEAVRHLFSVTSGLDSMVLGETEIAGQVKQAYERAQGAKLTGSVTNRLFQKALQTAKAVRTKTQIQRGATSVGSVAVELAEKIFGNKLAEKVVMIIGAGKMGEACLRHLAKKGIRSIIVANRSIERAQMLAAEFGGRAVNYMDDGLAVMREADIVISSTGCPEIILDREDVESVMQHRRDRPLFLIDIAVPRDIDPKISNLENVFLYDIDDLEEVVRENVKLREQELIRCREIIEEQAAELMSKLGSAPKKTPERVPAQPAWDVYEPAVCAI